MAGRRQAGISSANLIELDDVRMSKDLENVDLSCDSLDVSLFSNLILFQHLYRHLCKPAREELFVHDCKEG